MRRRLIEPDRDRRTRAALLVAILLVALVFVAAFAFWLTVLGT